MLGDGYGKIFKQIYAGTLRADWKALITFEQMIVLCTPDGIFDMPPEVLHNITGIPLDLIQDGLKTLESPDPRSRSPENDGRRIVRLDEHRDWGWQIVNHKFYRDLASREEKREADRLRIASRRMEEKFNKNKDVAICSEASQDVASVANVAYADAYADAVHIPSLREGSDSKLSPCPHQEIIKLYHDVLPMCPVVRVWTKKRAGYLNARWKEHPDLDWWKKLFVYVAKSKFLTGGVDATGDREPFVVDLEWLLQPSKLAKVIEGKYHRKAAK